jgi:hypothetical protein
MKAEQAAGLAWVGIIGGVIAYDYLAPEGGTLSEGVDYALEKHPIATVAAIGMTALHLLNAYEAWGIERFDPIHQAAALARRKVCE